MMNVFNVLLFLIVLQVSRPSSNQGQPRCAVGYVGVGPRHVAWSSTVNQACHG